MSARSHSISPSATRTPTIIVVASSRIKVPMIMPKGTSQIWAKEPMTMPSTRLVSMCQQYIIHSMIVVSKRPTLFRTAAHFYNECGAYQLRAVLNAFGKDALPEELYWTDWMRRHDWSLPWLMPAILRRYGIHSHCRLLPRLS